MQKYGLCLLILLEKSHCYNTKEDSCVFSMLFTLVYFVLAPDTICPTFVVKSLTTEKIESHAFSLGHFRRGEGCTRLIRNVRSKTVEDGVLFSAKCKYM